MITLNEELIKVNEKLVYSIVNRFSNKDNADDLYQVGMMAISKASKNYDKSKNVKFSTYAYDYILGDILKYISEDRIVKTSREVANNYSKIMKAKEYIYVTYGRIVSNEELSKLTGIDEVKINDIINACTKPESLDSYINDEKRDTLLDTIGSKETLSTTDLICLRDALSNLDEEERKFLYDRYYENKTQTELAKEKKITQVKVYRYERSLLDKLKEKMVA